MASLFPANTEWTVTGGSDAESSEIAFGRSWLFDFDVGEFVMTPTRKISVAEDTAAWLMWCQKAIRTPRYRHLIYSRDYGQEYEDLIGKRFSRAVLESEIERITTETLMEDSRTASLDRFTFDWSADSCYFTCRLRNIRDETKTLEGSVSV